MNNPVTDYSFFFLQPQHVAVSHLFTSYRFIGSGLSWVKLSKTFSLFAEIIDTTLWVSKSRAEFNLPWQLNKYQQNMHLLTLVHLTSQMGLLMINVVLFLFLQLQLPLKHWDCQDSVLNKKWRKETRTMYLFCIKLCMAQWGGDYVTFFMYLYKSIFLCTCKDDLGHILA